MYSREMVSQCRENSFLSVKFAAIQGIAPHLRLSSVFIFTVQQSLEEQLLICAR